MGAPLRRPKDSSPITERQRRRRREFGCTTLKICPVLECARRFRTGLADFVGALDNGGMLRMRRDGGTGRRSRLKICWGYPRAGSSPAPGIAARFSAPFVFLPRFFPAFTTTDFTHLFASILVHSSGRSQAPFGIPIWLTCQFMFHGGVVDGVSTAHGCSGIGMSKKLYHVASFS